MSPFDLWWGVLISILSKNGSKIILVRDIQDPTKTLKIAYKDVQFKIWTSFQIAIAESPHFTSAR